MTETKFTNRGFAFNEFTDRNGVKCHIQKSSIATEDCIWLGKDGIDIGLKGFIPYGVPSSWRNISNDEIKKAFGVQDIIADTCMHLTREQVKNLLPILQKFVDTGEIN